MVGKNAEGEEQMKNKEELVNERKNIEKWADYWLQEIFMVIQQHL